MNLQPLTPYPFPCCPCKTLLQHDEGKEVKPPTNTAAVEVEVVTTPAESDEKGQPSGLASMLRGWQPAPIMAVGSNVNASASRGGGGGSAPSSQAIPVEAVLSDARGGRKEGYISYLLLQSITKPADEKDGQI